MNDIAPPVSADGMAPVIFGDCLGWFHPPSSGSTGGTAILLCAGVSDDFCNGYRPFRLLAQHLAAAGYPALRFDYPGTGDSADPSLSNLWQAWQRSLTAAADFLLARTGAERLILIGLRIGGTLAAMAAAQRDDVAGLALIEPCLTGRSYVSQLVTAARLRGAQRQDGSIEVGELVFTTECLEQMRATELAQLVLPAALPVAIFSRTAEEKITTRLTLWQTPITCHGIGRLDAMLRPSHHGGEPELAATPLLDWLHRTIPPGPCSPRAVPSKAISVPLTLPGCTEMPLRFGATLHLVGILCRPARESFPGLAVLICNAGGNPRHGFARFGVECARALAHAGIASLRFDFAGLGDSIHNSGGEDLQTDVFTEDRLSNIRDLLDALEVLGYHRFALHGLCSGAYHAVHGGCSDSRISQLLAVNLPWFSLRYEPPGPDSVAQNCLNTLISRGTAALFLFGDNDTGLKLFERHFGEGGNLLPATSKIQLCIIPNLDHELTAGWMRQTVAAQITNFIQRQQANNYSATAEGEHRHDHA